MSVRYIEKQDYHAISMSADHWDATDGANGERIYTVKAGVADATVGVEFSATESQEHNGLKTGSSVTRHKDGSVTIKEQK